MLKPIAGSGDATQTAILGKIICKFVHPLTFSGNEQLTRDTITQFNQWLKYDNLELYFNGNEASLGSIRPYWQIKEEEELHFMEVDEETGNALHLIKQNI